MTRGTKFHPCPMIGGGSGAKRSPAKEKAARGRGCVGGSHFCGAPKKLIGRSLVIKLLSLHQHGCPGVIQGADIPDAKIMGPRGVLNMTNMNGMNLRQCID